MWDLLLFLGQVIVGDCTRLYQDDTGIIAFVSPAHNPCGTNIFEIHVPDGSVTTITLTYANLGQKNMESVAVGLNANNVTLCKFGL